MKSAITIAAHPDDFEFMIAGILPHIRSDGYQIHCLDEPFLSE